MQALIQLIKFSENPYALRTENRKECLTQSKEFTISSLTTIPRALDFLLECMASCTSTILSVICLSFKKPPWFSEISFGSRGLSRLQ
jgi:hypothetical protein